MDAEINPDIDYCSDCGEPCEDFNDWLLHEPLCISCWFERKNKEE